MKSAVVPIQIRLIFPSQNGCAVFLGNDEKSFVIYVDESVGGAIAMYLKGVQRERPLTHDLMCHMMKALGATRGQIMAIFLGQSMVVGTFGVSAGLGLGLLLLVGLATGSLALLPGSA